MEILKIIAIGIVAAVAAMLLKETRPEMALIVALGGGILIIIMVLEGLFDVVYTFFELAEKTGVDKPLFGTVVKIIGIAYVCEFSANICADAGSKGLGEKILFAGKICIMVAALPIITSLINIILEILP